MAKNALMLSLTYIYTPFVKFHLRKHKGLCIIKMTGGAKISFSETDHTFSAFVELHNKVSDLISPCWIEG